ncbi:hypothetical protein [Persicobacter diffluens]|uniref:Uncharacterized protein n=1 Tax=Persicobacter diffluens TaxID=981 RepID=A0AAN4VYS4_9BACT|nr:hypothetical protein PEDI_30560 [Persicobacter diffluens]
MKGILGTIMLMFLSASMTFSTDLTKKKMASIEKDVATMTAVMDLNVSQSNQIKELKIQQALKLREIYQTTPAKSPERKEAVKEEWKIFYTALKQVCTKEQIKKWNAHKNKT